MYFHCSSLKSRVANYTIACNNRKISLNSLGVQYTLYYRYIGCGRKGKTVANQFRKAMNGFIKGLRRQKKNII